MTGICEISDHDVPGVTEEWGDSKRLDMFALAGMQRLGDHSEDYAGSEGLTSLGPSVLAPFGPIWQRRSWAFSTAV